MSFLLGEEGSFLLPLALESMEVKMKEYSSALAQHLCFRSRSCTKIILLLLLLTAGVSILPAWAAAGAMDPGLFESLEKFHGHTCAGSLMGARLGLAARAALKSVGGEGKLKATCFSHACPVDGVQVAAGTTYGNRAIEVDDKNEQRLLLTAEKNGRQVEARLTKLAEDKGKLSRELTKKVRELPVGSPERQRLEKDAEEIFAWFRTAHDEDVVQVRVVK